jgi:hypothetical protein
MSQDIGGGPGTSSGSSLIHSATVTLTDAEIKGLPQAGIVIVPAPGAGKVIQLVLPGLAVTNVFAADYVGIDGSNCKIALIIGGDTGIAAYSSTWTISSSGLLNPIAVWGAGVVAGVALEGGYQTSGGQSFAISGQTPSSENQPMKIWLPNGVGDPLLTGGDPVNTLKVTVLYRVLDV